MVDRAKAYMAGVLSGEIVTGKWIKLAMQRHVDDLKRTDWQYYFDEDEAARILSTYSLFRFSKGAVSGQPFDLMPWFAALVYMAYGWRREGGGKRFRKIYCKVGRGNAKTANLVTVGTIGFLFDGAETPEVYWVATKKDQAQIGWDRQRAMLRMLVSDHPDLAPLLSIPSGNTSTRVRRTDGLSWVQYLGMDSHREDGASPTYALVDEFHAWDTTDLMDVLESGMVKVKDPMTWIITTAGTNPLGPNTEFLKACKNVLSGVVESEELLALIYELDEKDDWKDKTVWAKPNPGLGVSVTMTGLETEFNKIGTQGIDKERDFKTKNLNIEQASMAGWIPDDVWMKGADPFDVSELYGRECWCGLDLANTNDFNAFVVFFPPMYEGDKAYALFRFWTPENAVLKFHQKRPFVRKWADEGVLQITPGNVTDYDQIAADVSEMTEPFTVVAIGYDTALSSYLQPKLSAAGFRMEPYSQAPLWMTPPAKQVERLALSGLLQHGGNPVMRWMMSNVTMKTTDAGNNIPSRGKSMEKIDGVSALLNAVGQWLKDRGQPHGLSYLFEESEELIVI